MPKISHEEYANLIRENKSIFREKTILKDT